MVPVEVADGVVSRCFVRGCGSKERGIRFIFSPLLGASFCEPQNRKRLDGLKASSYSKLNKNGILVTLILSDFVVSKLALEVLIL